MPRKKPASKLIDRRIRRISVRVAEWLRSQTQAVTAQEMSQAEPAGLGGTVRAATMALLRAKRLGLVEHVRTGLYLPDLTALDAYVQKPKVKPRSRERRA